MTTFAARPWRLVLGGLAAAVAVGLTLGLSGGGPVRPAIVTSRHGMDGQATWAPGARPAPSVTGLHDQTGRVFSLASLRGDDLEIVFWDSRCHQECPLEGRELAFAERQLPAVDRPTLVAVSVNPQDTPASARRAVKAWGLAGLAPWRWLMGTRAQLAPVWRAYHVYVGHPAKGDIPHTELVYLVDRRGDERSAYLYPFGARFLIHDLRVLGRE